MNIARFLSLYKSYDEVKDLSGHIADLGSFKGAFLLRFAKFLQIFEPHSQTKVFGFDWFKGMKTGLGDKRQHEGKYASSKENLLWLIENQDLSGLIELNDVDLSKDY